MCVHCICIGQTQFGLFNSNNPLTVRPKICYVVMFLEKPYVVFAIIFGIICPNQHIPYVSV